MRDERCEVCGLFGHYHASDEASCLRIAWEQAKRRALLAESRVSLLTEAECIISGEIAKLAKLVGIDGRDGEPVAELAQRVVGKTLGHLSILRATIDYGHGDSAGAIELVGDVNRMAERIAMAERDCEEMRLRAEKAEAERDAAKDPVEDEVT